MRGSRGFRPNSSRASIRRSTDEAASVRRLLAYLLDFHRREDKAQWWEYYRLLEMPADELLDEGDAIAAPCRVGPVGVDKKSVIVRFSYPPQEMDLKRGDDLKTPRREGIRQSLGGGPQCMHGGHPWQRGDSWAGAGVRLFAHRREARGHAGVAVGARRALSRIPCRRGLVRHAPAAAHTAREPRRRSPSSSPFVGRRLPGPSGTARFRKDSHRRAHDPGFGRERIPGGDHGRQPQGHPQSARRGEIRGRCGGPNDSDRSETEGTLSRAARRHRGRAGQQEVRPALERRCLGRGRGDLLVLGAQRSARFGPHPVRRRSGPDVAGVDPGLIARGAQPGPARRPTAAGSASEGDPPRRRSTSRLSLTCSGARPRCRASAGFSSPTPGAWRHRSALSPRSSSTKASWVPAPAPGSTARRSRALRASMAPGCGGEPVEHQGRSTSLTRRDRSRRSRRRSPAPAGGDLARPPRRRPPAARRGRAGGGAVQRPRHAARRTSPLARGESRDGRQVPGPGGRRW